MEVEMKKIIVLVICVLVAFGFTAAILDWGRASEGMLPVDIVVPTVMPIPPLPLIYIEKSIWE